MTSIGKVPGTNSLEPWVGLGNQPAHEVPLCQKIDKHNNWHRFREAVFFGMAKRIPLGSQIASKKRKNERLKGFGQALLKLDKCKKP